MEGVGKLSGGSVEVVCGVWEEVGNTDIAK